jgi:membrane protein
VLYRYAPDRDKPQWRWVSPGAIVATILWIIASVGFTVYVANFSSYDKTYGSLGGVVVLLTWLYLSAFVVLFGAAIQCAIREADLQGFNRRVAATNGAARCTRGGHAWRKQELGELP